MSTSAATATEGVFGIAEEHKGIDGFLLRFSSTLLTQIPG
jgi:hypothetical protein